MSEYVQAEALCATCTDFDDEPEWCRPVPSASYSSRQFFWPIDAQHITEHFNSTNFSALEEELGPCPFGQVTQ